MSQIVIEDIERIASKLGFKPTDEQKKEILERYPSAQKEDLSGTFDLVVEQLLHEVCESPSKQEEDGENHLTMFENGIEDDEDDNEIKTADEIIDEIANSLRQADHKWIAHIANQVLSYEVNYIGEDTFKVKTP